MIALTNPSNEPTSNEPNIWKRALGPVFILFRKPVFTRWKAASNQRGRSSKCFLRQIRWNEKWWKNEWVKSELRLKFTSFLWSLHPIPGTFTAYPGKFPTIQCWMHLSIHSRLNCCFLLQYPWLHWIGPHWCPEFGFFRSNPFWCQVLWMFCLARFPFSQNLS